MIKSASLPGRMTPNSMGRPCCWASNSPPLKVAERIASGGWNPASCSSSSSVYVFEAVGLVNESEIRSGGHASAAIFEFIDEGHPELVIVLPFDLVLGRPVEPVRAVGFAAGLIELPERGQRVTVVPFGA